MAASATFALKSGEWFRRVRFVIFAPDSHAQPCALSGRDSTHRTDRNSGATSLVHSDHRASYSLRPRCSRKFHAERTSFLPRRAVRALKLASNYACLCLLAHHGLQRPHIFLGPWSRLLRLLRHHSVFPFGESKSRTLALALSRPAALKRLGG